MAETVVLFAVCFALYTYVGYPAILWLIGRFRSRPVPSGAPPEWPSVSITVPAYNEAHQIAETIESLLALDYPADRKQILIVSDASDDGTDDIVRSYADRGVELVRQPERRGKTAAEEAVAPLLTGDLVVNTDASIRIHRGSLRKIIAPFQDPEIGLVSGRDVSVGMEEAETNEGESGYVGYEMWVRDLETRVAGIVGASGSFYAIRRELHHLPLPEALSRDFAAALNTREHGLRPVSAPGATAVVPRARSLRREYPRKVRTITRGMGTLLHKRALLNPFRYGLFAWMLLSHKVCRWTLPWVGLAAYLALAMLAVEGAAWAAALFAAGSLGLLVGALGWVLSSDRPLPRPLSLAAFGLMGNVAALRAGLAAMRGARKSIWEPTRRTA